MPAQWTGQLVGEIHNAGLTIKRVAAEAGLNAKYISQVLNGDAESPKAEQKLRPSLGYAKKERRQHERTGNQEGALPGRRAHGGP